MRCYFRSRDKDGGYTIQSAMIEIPETSRINSASQKVPLPKNF